MRIEMLTIQYGAVSKVPLTGGRSTPGVYKDGNIVYRPHSRATDLYAPLLKYYESRHVELTHRYLGTVDGNDMFGFIDGYVPQDVGATTQKQLREFMGIVRVLHDISSDFLGDSDKVICHNDLSPCNTVFRDGIPVAVIDWDGASIGERWEDLAYIIWLWTNIGSHTRDTEILLENMADALQVYGPSRNVITRFPDKLISRMDRAVDDVPYGRWDYQRTVEWVDFSKEWVEENRREIEQRLGLLRCSDD